MAGFDLEKQRSYTLPGGGRGESSRVDFSAASFCQALPTTMTSIYAFNATPGFDVTIPGSNFGLNSTELGCTANIADITNSFIILKRQTNRLDVSSTWYVDIKGW